VVTISGFLAERRKRREHRWAHAHLSDYIDGELSAGERLRLRRHSDACEDCGPLLRALTVIVPELRRLRRAPQRSVVPDVIVRLRAEQPLSQSGLR
jgi:anti-sigma factor RsiW